jgi:hypothetical protein
VSTESAAYEVLRNAWLRLLAEVTPENADEWDPRFRGVADPRLISYEAR